MSPQQTTVQEKEIMLTKIHVFETMYNTTVVEVMKSCSSKYLKLANKNNFFEKLVKTSSP